MPSATVGGEASVLGKSFSNTTAITSDNSVMSDVASIAAAKTGTLTTRSSDTAGTLTMSSGHGFVDGDIIDIYWSTGQAVHCTVGTVATNSVPFTLANGDVLPIATTAITAMVQRVENVSFLDADVEALFLGAGPAACSVTFLDASDAYAGSLRVLAGTGTNGINYRHRIWHADDGSDIPVTADVASIAVTHGDSASARQVNFVGLLN